MTQQVKLYTVEEFEQWIALPEHRARRFELIDGEIVEKAMPTEEHGVIAANAATFLNLHLIQHSLTGRVAVEARHRPTGDVHNDRLPDVSYVAATDKPVTRRGAADFMPDLVVEIQSPDDNPKQMLDDAAFYLANGVKMVWLIYPGKRIVEVLTPDDRQLLTEQDTLNGSDVLPGLALPIASLFRGV